jgi:REP element-mobilizing transposase RayT
VNSLRRNSIRLQTYDYAAPGGYFVTMVTAGRKHLFGRIDGDQMQVSPCGRTVQECWAAIPEHFPNAELSAFVVTPNYVHGIIVLHETGDAAARRDTRYRAPTVPSEELRVSTQGFDAAPRPVHAIY